MMKKLFSILFLTVIITGNIFAQERLGGNKNGPAPKFSLGAGGRIFYNGMFDIWEFDPYLTYGGVDPYAYIYENNFHSNNGFGIGVFFDATYVEIGMDFIFGSFKPNYDKYTGDFELKSTQFGFTILGKFPFAAGPGVTVFPLAGIDYQIFLSGEADGFTIERDDMSGDFEDMYDAFSLVVGVGLDYNITTKLYLRGEVLVNFKMESDSDKALKRLAGENDLSFSLFTFGPRVSIGIGYRFF
ncbi:hypothetical protein FACS189450_13780 [Spirochaetia bacterium]|nr:hypothetical protein FACS189450_13780 [Spirochaetia bacterium]